MHQNKSKRGSVLVLNADYTPHDFTSMKRAIKLYITGKAMIVKEHENTQIHPDFDVGIPDIIALKNYVYIPYEKKSFFPTRRRILTRDNYRCQYCNVKMVNNEEATIDHVIPKSHPRYIGHKWNNVVACCKKCNNIKGSRTPEEANMPLLSVPSVPKAMDLLMHGNRPLREILEDIKSGKLLKEAVV